MANIAKLYGTTDVSIDFFLNQHFPKVFNVKAPPRDIIVQCLTAEASNLLTKIQSRLCKASFVNIVLNVMRVKTQRYLFIDAHFLHEGLEVSALLSVVPLVEENAGYIKRVVETVLPDLNVALKRIPNILIGQHFAIDTLTSEVDAPELTQYDEYMSDFRIIRDIDGNDDELAYFKSLNFTGRTFIKCFVSRLLLILRDLEEHSFFKSLVDKVAEGLTLISKNPSMFSYMQENTSSRIIFKLPIKPGNYYSTFKNLLTVYDYFLAVLREFNIAFPYTKKMILEVTQLLRPFYISTDYLQVEDACLAHVMPALLNLELELTEPQLVFISQIDDLRQFLVQKFGEAFKTLLKPEVENFEARFAVAAFLMPETRRLLTPALRKKVEYLLPKLLGHTGGSPSPDGSDPDPKKSRFDDSCEKRNMQIVEDIGRMLNANQVFNSAVEYANWLRIQAPLVYLLYSKLVPCPSTSIKRSKCENLVKLLEEFEKGVITSKCFNDRIFVFCNQHFM